MLCDPLNHPLSNFSSALIPLLFLSFFLSLSSPSCSCVFPADTKRKVEQISEELRSLDEMLAGNEGADGAVEVTADATSPPPDDDADRKGTVFLH